MDKAVVTVCIDDLSSMWSAIEQHFSVWGHGGMVGCRGDVGGWAPRLGDG